MSITLPDAAQKLRAGEPVAFATETVYGLGANALLERAVAAVYALKERPQFNPLIIHVVDAEAARTHVQWNARAEILAAQFWPGPLSLVLPRQHACAVSLLAGAGLSTLAVRVPAHPVAQALLRAAGVPIAAPSANRSGRISPTTAAHVRDEFGTAVPVLEGDACAVGLESTVIDLSGDTPVLLRPGSITHTMLEAALNEPVARAGAGHVKASPGMLLAHYAPSIPLRLNATHVRVDEALLAFGPHALSGAAHTLNLSERGDVAEAAAHLFAYLRALDTPEYAGIAVMPIPMHGLGEAINDRLARAAGGAA